MTNLTRNDIKRANKIKQAKTRNANTVKELELLFTISGLYIIDYYNKRPFKKMLAKIGLKDTALNAECTERAKRELSAVNYDYTLWKSHFGSNVGI